MNGTSFKVYQLIFLTLIGNIFAYGPYDFSNLFNLREQIRRQVRQKLAPLRNLDAKIKAHINRRLEPLSSEEYIGDDYSGVYPQPVVYRQPLIPPFLGPDLSGLNNLGQRIQQSVYEGLEPVRAMEITERMKNGAGGTTIATHLPEGRTFLITNNQISQCDGDISEDGKCGGTLTPFQIKNKKDYCYNRNGISIINDKICIGASTISVINNDIKCISNTGSPALLLAVEDYKKLCEDISTSVKYKYIANPQDPRHVIIPSRNKYVKCTNNQPGVCVFTESNTLPNASTGNIFISSSSIFVK